MVVKVFRNCFLLYVSYLSSTLTNLCIALYCIWLFAGKQHGWVVRALDLEVQIPFWPLADLVVGSLEFNFSATLVNSQLVFLLQVGILNQVMFIWIFIYHCLHWSWKDQMGSGQLSIFIYLFIYLFICIVLYCIQILLFIYRYVDTIQYSTMVCINLSEYVWICQSIGQPSYVCVWFMSRFDVTHLIHCEKYEIN